MDTKPQSRTARGTFQPGVSGNPGGRPKISAKVREMARAMTPKAIAALEEALDATKVVGLQSVEVPDHQVRISAANALLDRGWGKPSAQEDEDTPELEHISNDELVAMAKELKD